VKRYNHRDIENTVKKKNKLRAFRASLVKRIITEILSTQRERRNTVPSVPLW